MLTELSFRHAFHLVRVIGVPDIHIAWLVYLAYVRTLCVPIVTLNQNKRSRLLYLGNAQIIIIDSVYFLMEKKTPGVLPYICFKGIGLK